MCRLKERFQSQQPPVTIPVVIKEGGLSLIDSRGRLVYPCLEHGNAWDKVSMKGVAVNIPGRPNPVETY
jgi:hypothetical protein